MGRVATLEGGYYLSKSHVKRLAKGYLVRLKRNGGIVNLKVWDKESQTKEKKSRAITVLERKMVKLKRQMAALQRVKKDMKEAHEASHGTVPVEKTA